MRFAAWILVIAISVATAAGPVSAQTTTETTGPVAAVETEAQDREIDQRIEAIFDELDGLRGVFVTVRAGVVTLRGRVTETRLAERAVELAARVEGVVAVENEITEVTSVRERLIPVAERLTNRFWQTLGFIPLFTVAVLAWFVVFAGGLFVASRKWPWDKMAPNAFIAELLRQILRLGFFVAGLILALDILGATALLGTIMGAAGIVGLAIGFAVRDTVENYIASILLSVRQPFRPKDYVAIEGYEGFVIRLTSRATILMDASGNHIRIPNASVFKGNIVNYSRNPQRRFDFKIGVGVENDLDKTLDVGLNILADLDFILDDPGPNGWIETLGDSNVVFTFVAWIDQTQTSLAKAKSEAIRLTMRAFDSNGISMPEPTYRLIGTEVSKPAAPKRRTKAAPPPSSEEINDTAIDESVTRRVEEERAAADGNDLLSQNAKDELGST